jgi:hypothetical protein
MELTKDEVSYLYEQACFGCRYSQIDPYDWGLRCCNGDCTFCTEYCPEQRCECYEEDKR